MDGVKGARIDISPEGGHPQIKMMMIFIHSRGARYMCLHSHSGGIGVSCGTQTMAHAEEEVENDENSDWQWW